MQEENDKAATVVCITKYKAKAKVRVPMGEPIGGFVLHWNLSLTLRWWWWLTW